MFHVEHFSSSRKKLKRKSLFLHNVHKLWDYFTSRYSSMDVKLFINQYSTNPAGNW